MRWGLQAQVTELVFQADFGFWSGTTVGLKDKIPVTSPLVPQGLEGPQRIGEQIPERHFSNPGLQGPHHLTVKGLPLGSKIHCQLVVYSLEGFLGHRVGGP